MKEFINEIEFPAVDISIEDWNSEIVNEVFMYDGFFYNKSDKVFKEEMLNHKIVDSKGNVYQIIAVEKLNGWKKWIPFFSKRKMYFQFCNENFSLDELKKIILNKVESLDYNEYKEVWIQNIKEATHFKDLFFN